MNHITLTLKRKLQMTRKIIMVCLVSITSYELFLHTRIYASDQIVDQSTNKDFTVSYISEIINNTYSPLIVTSPDIKNGNIFITKNISLVNGKESIPCKSTEYSNALQIAPRTKSLIANLRMPVITASVDNEQGYKIRPNNYNPGTIHAICIDLPPQKFQLNYSIVHKPLPVIAVRQKGNLLDIIQGDGLNSIKLDHKKILEPMSSSIIPFVEKIENNATYSIEVSQIKPIGHFENLRHDGFDDLSTMYLDGGAWVTPLHLNPHTLDIVIRKNSSSQE